MDDDRDGGWVSVSSGPGSPGYFEYEVYLLNYTIKIKNLNNCVSRFFQFFFKKARFLKPIFTVCNT